MTPRASVLLPVRDGERFLADALDSLCAQTFEDFEILVEDDGSKDASPKIAEAAAAEDPRVRPAAHPPQGIVAALNRAAARARSDLFVRMDADDRSCATRLERLIAAAVAHPGASFFGSRIRYEPREHLKEGLLRYEAWLDSMVSHDLILRDRFVECPLLHPSWALRRSLFDDLGGYRDGDSPEDYDFFLRAVAAGARFHRVDEVLVEVRDRPDRLSRSDPRYGLDRFFELKVRHLVPRLLADTRAVAVVGGGRNGKRWVRRLAAEGVRVACLVDVHPRRVGESLDGVPIVGHDALPPVGTVFFLSAVGHPDGRRDVRGRLGAAGAVEGDDYLCVQ